MPIHQLTKAHGPDNTRRRYYVDGRRVSFAAWYALDQRATRQDSFCTIRRGNRWLHHKAAHVAGRA